jgi:hypothetical protein
VTQVHAARRAFEAGLPQLPCGARQPIAPARDCVACHRAIDVHAGSLGTKCESCHGLDAWKKDIRFDHDVTAFPLLGQHVAVPCAGCHTTKKFKDAPKECGDCHKADDVHKGNLGKDCARCHSPNAWTRGSSTTRRKAASR